MEFVVKLTNSHIVDLHVVSIEGAVKPRQMIVDIVLRIVGATALHLVANPARHAPRETVRPDCGIPFLRFSENFPFVSARTVEVATDVRV